MRETLGRTLITIKDKEYNYVKPSKKPYRYGPQDQSDGGSSSEYRYGPQDEGKKGGKSEYKYGPQ
jgi:hypothetical protein